MLDWELKKPLLHAPVSFSLLYDLNNVTISMMDKKENIQKVSFVGVMTLIIRKKRLLNITSNTHIKHIYNIDGKFYVYKKKFSIVMRHDVTFA